MTNPYAVLGVSPAATQAEITHAYRDHLRAYHPDTSPLELNRDTSERLRQILTAYALLRDPARRAAYDRAHPIRKDARPVRIPVSRLDAVDDQPPLRVGPVRWHRSRGRD